MNQTFDVPAGFVARAAATLPALPYQGWHFGDSIAFEAMVAAGRETTDPATLDFAHGFIRGWTARRPSFRPLDCTAPGRAMVHVARLRGDGVVMETALALAEYLCTRRTIGGVFQTWDRSPLREPYGHPTVSPTDAELLNDPGPGVFVDCLHFDPPFFAALFAATGRPEWQERAIGQASAYVTLLQDGATGLFAHFFLERTGRRYIPDWGRGQGWALLGLLDVIEDCAGHPAVDRLHESAERLALAMLARQRPDGSWPVAVSHPASGDETSTGAFMATGLRRAARLLSIPAGTRRQMRAGAGAARAATLRSARPDGTLDGVSDAVWASTVESHYWNVPRGDRVPWGQGALVLALLGGTAPQRSDG